MTSTCCRLCLANSDDLESIFSVKNGSLLLDLIKIICPIPIETAEDDLPQSVCQECVEIVTSAHQIRLMSVQSDFKLRSMRYRDPLIKSEVVVESSVIIGSPQNHEEQDKQQDEDHYDWDNDDSMQHSEYEPISRNEGGNKRLAKRLKCDRCQFRTSFKNTMAIHTRSHLTGKVGSAEKETQFQCNFCENVYANRCDRQRHIRFKHQGMRKHAAKESFGSSSSSRHTEAGSNMSESRPTNDFNYSTPQKSTASTRRVGKIIYEYFEEIDPEQHSIVFSNTGDPRTSYSTSNKLTKLCCRACGKPISNYQTNMEKHLRSRHLRIYTKYLDLKAEAKCRAAPEK